MASSQVTLHSEEGATWCADAPRKEVTDLLVSRMQVASLLQWIRTMWPMSDDARRADLVFVHPFDVDERDPIGPGAADRSPASSRALTARAPRTRAFRSWIEPAQPGDARQVFLDDLDRLTSQHRRSRTPDAPIGRTLDAEREAVQRRRGDAMPTSDHVPARGEVADTLAQRAITPRRACQWRARPPRGTWYAPRRSLAGRARGARDRTVGRGSRRVRRRAACTA